MTVVAGRLEAWAWLVACEKATHHTLNLFAADVSGILAAEGWIVTRAIGRARSALARAHAARDQSMPSLLEPAPLPWPKPPTYFATNSFTDAFQEFVNTYGVPRYKEANPALFTAATFPFLFGVMYGDVGHGLCLTLFGVCLIVKSSLDERRKGRGGGGGGGGGGDDNEMLSGVLSARSDLSVRSAEERSASRVVAPRRRAASWRRVRGTMKLVFNGLHLIGRPPLLMNCIDV